MAEAQHIPDDDVEVVRVGEHEPVLAEPVEEEVESTEEPEAEPVATEEVEEPPVEEEAQVEEEESQVDEPPTLSPEELQAKIAELEETIEDRKAKAEEWTKKAREKRDLFFQPWKQPVETEEPATAEQVELEPEPQQEDFETYDDYYRALARWETDQRILYHNQQRMNQSMIAELEVFKEGVVEAGVAKYGDFEEVARDPSLAITTQMLDVMRELEYPEDVAYYLGRNPHEAIKIARQTPAGIAVSLVQLENKIQTELKTNPPERPTSPQPRTTSAPPPVRPVTGGAEQVEKDPNKMSPAEYRAWREAGGGGGEYG